MKKCKTSVRRLTSFSREFPSFTTRSMQAKMQSRRFAESVDDLKEEILEVEPNEFEAIFVLSDDSDGDAILR